MTRRRCLRLAAVLIFPDSPDLPPITDRRLAEDIRSLVAEAKALLRRDHGGLRSVVREPREFQAAASPR